MTMLDEFASRVARDDSDPHARCTYCPVRYLSNTSTSHGDSPSPECETVPVGCVCVCGVWAWCGLGVS